ncbi:unnamed protein product [Cuscuta epithymum]|uniref:Uncharacterized protein n=1 Tax=Cuscuta epithymum TaxID=186058 RepID=A0AAV0GHD2_9ASTE|nr:unnamed protein product [Cuscuta epithymum]CAH9146918.1 unnamed protein product [Cuscuta epithymum]CAH9146921.1 unnamed protein product [Cuscuta epithymum]CAH9146922.1 unnamed protein product [Cuscuta epithymum]CAH9146923.1 unnamed protein product [Cuscuta epithymum]
MAIASTSMIRASNLLRSFGCRELSSPFSHPVTPLRFFQSSKFTLESSRSQLSIRGVAATNQKHTLSEQSLPRIASCHALKSIMKHYQAAALLLFGLLLVKTSFPCYPAFSLPTPAPVVDSSSSTPHDDELIVITEGHLFIFAALHILLLSAFFDWTTAIKFQVAFHGPVDSLFHDLCEINVLKKIVGYNEGFEGALSCLCRYSKYAINYSFDAHLDRNFLLSNNRVHQIFEEVRSKFENARQAAADNIGIKENDADDQNEYLMVTITAQLFWWPSELNTINNGTGLDEVLQKLFSVSSNNNIQSFGMAVSKLLKQEVDSGNFSLFKAS